MIDARKYKFECASCGHLAEVFRQPPAGCLETDQDSFRISREFLIKWSGWIFEPDSGVGFCSTDCVKGG